jgi:hypothetical protein
MMRSRLTVALLLIAFVGCRNSSPAPPPASNQPAFQPPTATEVFSLRSQCAELGQKIMENNVVGVALTQGQASHYNPRTNRCYIELTIQTADTTAQLACLNRVLYDGQTNEMLAFATMKNGQKTGAVFVKTELTSENFFDSASAFIDKMMEDDRKQ